jgi:DnaJ-class molecular chaperone
MNNIKGKSKNYYRLLNLKKNASSHEILISYQKLITHWNNYIDKTPLAKERIKDIKKAYNILSDPVKKKKYDTKIKKRSSDDNSPILNSDIFNNNLLGSIIGSISMLDKIMPMATQIKVIDLTNNLGFNSPEIKIINQKILQQ